MSPEHVSENSPKSTSGGDLLESVSFNSVIYVTSRYMLLITRLGISRQVMSRTGSDAVVLVSIYWNRVAL